MSLQQATPAVSNPAAQLPARSPPPLNFLDLPCEIRDMIYRRIFRGQKPFQLHLCTEHDRFKRYGPVTSFEVSYKEPESVSEEVDPEKTRPRGMYWMLTNKQIFQEAREQFQRKATWTMIEEARPFDVRKRGALSRWSNPNYSLHRSDVSFQTCLLMPIAARNIEVQTSVELDTFARSDQYGKPVWVVKILADGKLPLLIAELRGSTKLRTLSICIDAAPPGYDFEDDANQFPVKVELDHLDALRVPSLKKLEVYVTWHPLYEARTDIKLAFESALDGLGMSLVGGQGAIAHLIDGDEPLHSLCTYTRT